MGKFLFFDSSGKRRTGDDEKRVGGRIQVLWGRGEEGRGIGCVKREKWETRALPSPKNPKTSAQAKSQRERRKKTSTTKKKKSVVCWSRFTWRFTLKDGRRD